MNNLNYFGGIVKILENPTESLFNNTISVSKFRVQFPQLRTTKLINVVFSGNLARDVSNYYKANDYIIIEGYISLPKKQNSKRVEITVRKVYPFLLNYDRETSKT